MGARTEGAILSTPYPIGLTRFVTFIPIHRVGDNHRMISSNERQKDEGAQKKVIDDRSPLKEIPETEGNEEQEEQENNNEKGTISTDTSLENGDYCPPIIPATLSVSDGKYKQMISSINSLSSSVRGMGNELHRVKEKVAGIESVVENMQSAVETIGMFVRCIRQYDAEYNIMNACHDSIVEDSSDDQIGRTRFENKRKRSTTNLATEMPSRRRRSKSSPKETTNATIESSRREIERTT